MKRLLKWLAIIIIILLLVLICVLAASYFLLATERGFKIASDQLGERVEGLDMGSVQGDLGNGISSDKISFENEQVSLQANGVESQWRSDCLIDRAVCLDKVVIDELNIQTFDTGQKAPATSGDITLPVVNLPVSFNAKDILVKTFRFQPPGDAPVQELKNVKLSAHTTGNTLNIDELSTQYQNIAVHTSGSITPDGDYPLDLNLRIDVEDAIDTHDVSTNINLGGSLENLLVNANIDGAVKASVRGRLEPLKKSMPAELIIEAAQAGWPLDTLEIAKVNDLVLQVDGDMSDYNIKVDTKVAGANIPESQVSLSAKANTERALVTDITTFTLDGFATGNAAVSWKDGITWVSELIAKDINPAAKYDGVDGKLNGLIIANGSVVDGQWTLNLNKAHIDGVLRDLPFELDVKLQKHADETWQLDKLTLDNGKNTVKAAGALSDQWDLVADANLPELQNLLPGLTGGFKADVALKGELKNPDVQIKAQSDSLNYNDISVAGLSLDTNISRGALDNSTLKLNIRKIAAGEQAISNTKLSLSGTRQQHQLALFADGPQKTSVDITASGGLNDRFDWDGVLKTAKLEIPAHEINLRDATKLGWNNETKKFAVDAHCWSIQTANLCLKNKVLAENTGQANVSLDTYNLEQLNPFLPAESTLNGLLNTDVVLNWGADFAGGYAAKLNADIGNGAIKVKDGNGQPLRFQYDTLTLQTNADANMVDSTLSINSKSMGQANIDLKLDPSTENKAISGKVNLSGFQIGFLKAFLPNYDEIAGSVSAEGELSGELLDPLYNGNVLLSSLVVRSEDLPIAIDGGAIKADIAGKRASLDGQLQSGKGNIEIDGSANWQNNTWRADIKLKSRDLNVVQDPLTESTVNTNITISARPERIRVRGSIDVPAAEINIKELPRGAATVSDDVIVIEDIYAETQKQKKKQQQKTDLDVKVNVSLGDNVNLAGYGLTASLTGNMQVSQRSPNPVQLGGEITVVNGVYKQYGQDLKVTDGQILFVGPVDQTTLNIDAVREIEDKDGQRVAGLHIEGAIENPEISLFTEPADKTQESILSYIVLGRDIGDNSSEESNLLASAALALTLRGGRAYTDDLANKLGIQEISLDARGRGDTTEVVVSGRVNDRLLLRYGRSVFDDSFTLYLRYDLTKQLYLEAAQGAARAVDLFYSFSF